MSIFQLFPSDCITLYVLFYCLLRLTNESIVYIFLWREYHTVRRCCNRWAGPATTNKPVFVVVDCCLNNSYYRLFLYCYNINVYSYICHFVVVVVIRLMFKHFLILVILLLLFIDCLCRYFYYVDFVVVVIRLMFKTILDIFY